MIYEHIPLDITPEAMRRLEPVILKLAEDEWEDAQVQIELMNLANDFRSRLQRIGKSDKMQISGRAIK